VPTPTEIFLTIDTNACASLSRVDIYVGGTDGAAPQVASAPGCTDVSGRVGTLALLPSGRVDARVQIAVVGAGGGACTDPATTEAQCIVSRRVLSFVQHRRLDLPIFLDSACAGHVCPTGQTCEVVQGAPVCVGETCDADGGVACALDGGTLVDVSSPVVCGATAPDAGAKPTLKWSFDNHNNDGLIHEDNEAVPTQAQADGYFANDPTKCGDFYVTRTQAQPLAVDTPALVSQSFEVAFLYKMTGDAPLVSLAPDNSTFGGWGVQFQGGHITASACASNCTFAGTDSVSTADGLWHAFAMRVVHSDAGTTPLFTLYRDGIAFASTYVPYAAAPGTLQLQAPGAAIDQLEFYVLP